MRRNFTCTLNGEPVGVEADVTINRDESGKYPGVDILSIECRDPANMADADTASLVGQIIDALAEEGNGP